jgi:CheY-like chemotaxis protein/anti-sigma regulatory factor (Ser/Thr protein kinase)
LKQYIEQVSFSSKILLAVVEEVLDYSNLMADGINLKPESMHLENTIANVITTVQDNAAAKHTELISSIESDIAEYVITDPRRFTQLLISLCSNAIKCTDHGSVCIRARQESSWLYITVEDNGIGIDEETLAKMVSPFSKANESTARKFGGTGLGLAIGRQLAIMMQGELAVASEIGKGSTYTLKIPYQEGKACVGVQQPERLNLRGLSVLLAEDNPVNQLLATKILEKSGMRVDLAVDGQVAVDKAMRSSYDVILMDLQMPHLSGSEATEHIRKRGCNAPIIALTANTTESDREACFNAGMDDFLAKPVAQNVLLEKIGYWSSREGEAHKLN